MGMRVSELQWLKKREDGLTGMEYFPFNASARHPRSITARELNWAGRRPQSVPVFRGLSPSSHLTHYSISKISWQELQPVLKASHAA
ncbi:hypothetical protein SUGI_0930170 [Cryptomeria japonica]|nr:hypothetical protein SUGI_0930170 [Cryptomeria japonica]